MPSGDLADLFDPGLTDLDQFAERVPFDTFDRLRREAPVYWHPEGPPNHGFWAVTRHDDVDRVHHDVKTFSSEVGAVSIEELDDEQLSTRKSMIDMDAPGHTQLRATVNHRFTPRAVGAYMDQLRILTRETLDQALAKEQFDFVDEISRRVPVRMLCRILDLPMEDSELFVRWGNALFGNTDPEYTPVVFGRDDTEPYRHLPFRSPSGAELFAYASNVAAERGRDPGPDVLSMLLRAVVDGRPLTEREFQNNFQLLLVAGNETTRQAISHSMLALMDHPEQLRRLTDDPSLMPVAVEEMLRWATPIYQFRRTATRDVVLRGQRIRRGDKVVAWYISANRDEDVFAEPYRFDITRSPNPHVTFGPGGPHFCLGAHLARLELRVLFEELLPRIRHIELTGPATRLRSNFINGIKHLPVQVATK